MGLIAAERRALLRRLKTDFDRTYRQVEVHMDRSHDIFRAAEEAYKDWRRAIDVDALSLIDDIEALEAENDMLRREVGRLTRRSAPASAVPSLSVVDIERRFEEMDDNARLREQIDGP